MKRVIIIGGGAAGLFAASFLKKYDVTILEHNDAIAKKIAISGGGKCNITNRHISSSHYHSSYPKKIEQIFKEFSNKELLAWLGKKGCKPVLKKHNQYFCPKSSYELIAILKKEQAANIVLQCEVEGVSEDLQVHTSKGTFAADVVLAASGGISYKKVGGSGIGFEIAKSFGHTIVPLAPALVGLSVQREQFWFKELSGISLKARVEVGEKVFRDDILFTHRGISGPAILNASLYWQKGHITIAFLPKLPKLLPHKQISTQIPLPKRFTKKFLQSIGIEDKKVRELGKGELQKLSLLTSYSFAPAGTFGYERAEVTRGGVDLDELDELMQSRLKKGLFFAGEVCDATGELGGYNFQWAFSSAYVATKGIDRYLKNL